ncbi:ABC transporter permease [Ensifer adhaerens]|uniref:ABC transporter permease n=1 Tax=Ensifer adhaerens TaxID=106592 RepID=A0A0L8BI58_ENSAD|nr:ABC transporter permease [Ensifer adhaerens]
MSVWRTFIRKLGQAPIFALSAAVVVIGVICIAVFAPWIAPYGEAEIVSQIPFDTWSSQFPLGTDQLGRDVLSRLIYGARNSVGIALVTTILAFTIGGVLGMAAALAGGVVDNLMSRCVDILMSIPQLVFALVLLAIFGASIPNLIMIIAVLDATRVYRIARATAANVVVMEYVAAAQLRGETSTWIVLREILPNVSPTLVAEFGLRFCFIFLTISALSFLGVGIQPPTADWGSMVRENATLISYGDITPLVPAAAIAVLTISVNVVVDWYLDIIHGGRDGC